MLVQITIDTNDPAQLSVLQSLLGNGAAPAAASKPAAKKAAAAPAPAPAPEPEPEEDVLGGSATLEDAVAAATKLVAAGKTSEVKAALNVAGVKRVSELSGDQISKFMTALDS